MRDALRNIAAKGQRDRLVLAMFSYAHRNNRTALILNFSSSFDASLY